MIETDKTIIGDKQSYFINFVERSIVIAKNGIHVSNELPNEENFNYYSCFSIFSDILKKQQEKIIYLMQDIVEKAEVAGNIKQRDVEEKYDLLIETNDVFLDQAGTCMDDECGLSKNPNIELIVTQAKIINNLNGCWNSASNISKQVSSNYSNAQSIRLLAGKNIQRPQLTFKDKIDNSKKPWYPKIIIKPNSLKPLVKDVEYAENSQEVYNHPYKFELDMFDLPERQLIKKLPIKFKPIDQTPLMIIKKVEELDILLQDLQNSEELAVDLEHHAYRSFQGITCLMQISTRNTDYLIDTLSLRSELHVLNQIFTKPSILKVFHGADSDILWLQRDLSLYIVNMFDTHQAAKQLELPFVSLSYLLKTFCSIDPNKNFQLADWRIRPLPEELIKYAREDTHYLLYLKDILSNALIDAANGQNNILKAVYIRSTDICKSSYSKPIWSEDSYLNIYRKSQKMFNNRQIFALKELHKWRDETAREEDDSTNYVLPNHMLLNIAEVLPREMQGILACCNPIPPLVRQNLLKIHKMILKARDQPLIKPILDDNIRKRLMQRTQILNLESWAFALHDLPSDAEVRANLPCLLHNAKDLVQLHKKMRPAISVFDDSSSENEKKSNVSKHKKKKLRFISPFERYKQVQPLIVEQEKKEIEKQQQDEIERVKRFQKSQEDTEASISRVYEHFLKVSKSSVMTTFCHSKPADDSKLIHTNNLHDRFVKVIDLKHSKSLHITPQVEILGHMYDKKRKRQLSPEATRSYNKKYLSR